MRRRRNADEIARLLREALLLATEDSQMGKMSAEVFLARAGLLRARLSHSRGSSGGRRLRVIDNLSRFRVA